MRPCRQDLTHLNIMTIDGERTRDFDDALSLEEVPDGWRLGIHIADVSAHVMPQTPWIWRPRNGGPPFTCRSGGCPCCRKNSRKIP